MANDGALQAIESLRQRSKLSKDRHFAAAERKSHLHAWIGLPTVLINVFVGIVIGNVLQADKPPAWAPIAAVSLSFVAAALSAVLTFFNFARMAESHRAVANRYLCISTACEHLVLENGDQPIKTATLWEKVRELQAVYHEINEDAEAFPTTLGDLKRAKSKHSLVPFVSPVKLVENGKQDAPNPSPPPEAAPSVSRGKSSPGGPSG